MGKGRLSFMAEQTGPEPVIGALILNSAGKALFVKSHKWRDKYCIPGGHIELGESLSSAVKREVKEETGLNVDNIEFICFQEFIFDNSFWTKKHFLCFLFSCMAKETNVVLDNSELQDHVWVPPREALNLPVAPYVRATIKEYERLQGDKK